MGWGSNERPFGTSPQRLGALPPIAPTLPEYGEDPPTVFPVLLRRSQRARRGGNSGLPPPLELPTILPAGHGLASSGRVQCGRRKEIPGIARTRPAER